MQEWEDKPGDALTNQQIYDKLSEYKDSGIFEYVIPTDPIGQEWVLGIDGQIVKLKGKPEALALMTGVNSVLVMLSKKLGAGVVPERLFAAT